MQHRDPQYSNVVPLRSMNSDTVHTSEFVIEEFDHWSNSPSVEAMSFCGACTFDGDAWNQAA